MATPEYLTDPHHPFGKISIEGLNTDSSYNDINVKPGIYYWAHGDNPENFEANKKIAGADWKYHTKEVKYTLNSSGYRTPEWNEINWKESIVLLGGSDLYGIGISDEETICHHLEKLSGRPVINLGIPGGSNDLMVYNSTKILECFESPYAVISVWTVPSRFAYFDGDRLHHAGAWDSEHESNVADLWRAMYENQYHECSISHREALAIKHLWQGRSKYISISFVDSNIECEKRFDSNFGARDFIHSDESVNIEAAKYLHERLCD